MKISCVKVKRHKQFVKDLKKIRLTDSQFQKLAKCITLLAEGKPLPVEFRDHELIGVWHGFREFHLGGDVLVIYRSSGEEIVLVRIGTHNQLFK